MTYSEQGYMLKPRVQLGDMERRIIAAYHRNPKVADSDRLLVLGVWEQEGLGEVLGETVERFGSWFADRASSTETICRAGRKLRSQGLITASPEVAEARRELAQAHRDYWSR